MVKPYRDLTSKKIHVTEYELELEKPFHLKSLYRMMYNWLLEEQYRDPKDGGDRFEKIFLKKVDPTGHEELHWWWRVEKVPEGANKSYWAYSFKIHCKVVGHGKVKQKIDNKTYKMDTGAFTIYFHSYLNLDRKRKWQKHPVLKHFDDIYRKRIIRDKILFHINEVYKESYRFQNAMKKFFEIQTPYEVPRTFTPERGYVYDEGPDTLPEESNRAKKFYKTDKFSDASK